MNKWKKRSITDRFNVACEGIFETIRTERHMKFHCFATIVVCILILFMDIGKYEIMALIGSMTLVWFAELVNTSIETIVDMITDKYNPLAKRAKDISAGAVLITSINAMIVGYIVFEKKIVNNIRDAFYILKHSYQNMVFSIFLVIVLLVITIKASFRRGEALRGGLPSGHSALATSIATLIISTTNNPKIFVLTIILTILVIHSRIESKIHTPFEAVMGAILGWGVTYLVLLLTHL